MKALAVCVLLVLALIAVGWISFSQSPDKANVHIETEKIQQDSERMVESGKDLAGDVGDAIGNLDDSDVEQQTDENNTTP